MPDLGGPNTDTRRAPEQDSQVFIFFLATFFLVIPIAILLTIALRGQSSASETRSPSDEYQQAVLQASQPGVAPVSHALVSVPYGQPIKVVTWTRAEQVAAFKDPKRVAFKDTWVTVVPYLKVFCQEFVKEHGADSQDLSQRLQQRLGLPLSSHYDTFVELTINPKDISELFRPCGDPSPGGNSCDPAKPLTRAQIDRDLAASDPKDKQAAENRYWFFNNYYGSYASKDQYPWTSLGYTFDWATRDGSADFKRFGESEFVIPAGAPITFVSATDTLAYCSAQ